MKQRLLYAFLMLFMVAGMARAAASVSIKVTSTGAMPVTVTLNGEATVTVDDNVKLSTDKKTVTLAQGYTSVVEVTSTTATTATVIGRMDKLEVADGGSLTTLTLSKDNYVKELIVSGSKLETLTCSGLMLETLDVSGATALKTLDASNNKLKKDDSNLKLSTSLTNLNLSDNLLSGDDWDIKTFTALKELNVSKNQLEDLLGLASLSSLEKLNLSDNKILKLTANPAKADCAITWGVQTLKITTPPSYGTDANKGYRISNLIVDAGITADKNQPFSDVSWQIKDGTVYKNDNNKTAHQQSGAWADEYRFYDATTKEYVKGTYQCSLKTGGREYKISELEVWTAKFTLKGITPQNATDFKVSVNGTNAVDVSSGAKVKQGDELLFTVTPADGYETAVYTIEGMVPAVTGQQAPYKGTSFASIVKGLYKSQAEEVAPKISAVVLGKEHIVSYENKTQDGGSFTVQKVSGTTTSDLASNDNISAGDKLLIKIKPNTGYDFVLTINGVDKTSSVKKSGSDADYTYEEEVNNTTYPGTSTITVSVTFKNPSVKASVLVDGADLSAAVTSIKNYTVTIQKPDGAGETVNSNATVDLLPNTTYQAIFSTVKVTSGTTVVYRLKDITINGGELKSVKKDDKGSDEMQYTVAFTVQTSDVTLSITTKQMTPASIVPVENNGVADQQKQVYDGKAKPVLFSTIPANLDEHVKVTYARTTGSVDMGTTEPVNADTYTATLKFEENDYYIPDATNGEKTVTLTISKAPLTIETLPTVTIDKAGKYVITGGKVKFNDEEIKGTFSITPSTPSNPGVSHTAEVSYTPTAPADAANFEVARATVNVLVPGSELPLYSVTMAELPSSYSVLWMNGDKPVDISKETFADGTVLTAIISYPKGTKDVDFTLTSAGGNSTVTQKSSEDGRLVKTVTIKENTELKVVAGIGNTYKITFKNQKTDFTGEPLAYKPETGLTISDKNDQPVSWATIGSSVSVTYKDASGKVVALPVDAGTYTVCVSIAADKSTGYVETTAESAAFIVNKIKPVIYTMPKASVIAKGQALSLSDLTGGAANIPGKFTWKDGTKSFTVAGSYKQPVVFTPEAGYDKNYLTVETGGEGTTAQVDYVSVNVSDLQIVTFVQTEGTITVTNQLGQTLPTGSAVTKGDVLTIKVEPREGLELKSLTVNGSNNTGVYTVGTSSVAIEATFQPKVVDPEPSDPVIDPNSQYAVTLPKANDVRGVLINKPGVNAVLKDKSFSFTVGALAADLSKIVVKVNGSELKSSADGTYTIAKVSENTTVQISLADPTPLVVSIEKVTKNQNGKILGTVGVDGPADGICYFNDVITLVAYPESGVTFIGWSDDKDVKSQLRKLTLTKDITIKPLFSGIPTGIESIATTQIQGGKGYLMITGAGQANVTIVGMAGRIQHQQISGDSRIELSSGVYGVILEEGTNVVRTKVIVK